MSAPTHDGPETDVSRASVGELLGDITRDLSTLVRQEVELAKAELRQEATKTGKAAGMFGGAGFAGYLVVLFLSLALWAGLANVMDEAWAALIVAVLWAIVGAVLFVMARQRMRQVRGLRQTTETVREMPDALRGRDHSGASHATGHLNPSYPVEQSGGHLDTRRP